MRKKQFLFNVLGILVGIIIFCGVGEFFFRIFRGPPNPLASITQKSNKFLFAPNKSVTRQSSKEGEFEYTATINSHGYRGRDFSLEKTSGKKRIILIGDSFTYGVGADNDETIAHVLEELVLDNGGSVEIINAGIGHASPIKHFVNLRDMHLKFDPDAVILLFDFTDLRDDWFWEMHSVRTRSGDIVRFDEMFTNGKRDWWRTLCHYSSFAKWVNNKIVRSFHKLQQVGLKTYIQAKKEGKRIKSVIAAQESSRRETIEFDGMMLLRGRKQKEQIDKHWTRTTKYLDQIHQLLKNKNIDFAIGMYPHGTLVGKNQWTEGRKFWGFQDKVYTDYYAFELMEKFTQERGILFINTLPRFLQADPKQMYFFSWDGHMTPQGYALVAEGVYTDPGFQQLLNAL